MSIHVGAIPRLLFLLLSSTAPTAVTIVKYGANRRSTVALNEFVTVKVEQCSWSDARVCGGYCFNFFFLSHVQVRGYSYRYIYVGYIVYRYIYISIYFFFSLACAGSWVFAAPTATSSSVGLFCAHAALHCTQQHLVSLNFERE